MLNQVAAIAEQLGLNLKQLGVLLLLLALVFIPIERLWPRQRQKICRPDFLTDLAYYFFGGTLTALLLMLVSPMLLWLMQGVVPGRWLHWVTGQPGWLLLLLSLLLGDLAYYWAHRWSHQVPWLWQFHAIHHSAERMDWLVNTRTHPVDATYTRCIVLVPSYLLGLMQGGLAGAGSLVVAVTLFNRFWTSFVHANVRWRLRWLDGLISTPAFHHWHHTNDGAAYVDKNYAALFPLWDRMFGSFFLPEAFPQRYGISQAVSPGFLHQLIRPLARTGRDASGHPVNAGQNGPGSSP